jgi:hypothetical protein
MEGNIFSVATTENFRKYVPSFTSDGNHLSVISLAREIPVAFSSSIIDPLSTCLPKIARTCLLRNASHQLPIPAAVRGAQRATVQHPFGQQQENYELCMSEFRVTLLQTPS